MAVTCPGRYCLSQYSLRPPLTRAHCQRLSKTEASGGLWEVLLPFNTGTPMLMKFQKEARLGEAGAWPFLLHKALPFRSHPWNPFQISRHDTTHRADLSFSNP